MEIDATDTKTQMPPAAIPSVPGSLSLFCLGTSVYCLMSYLATVLLYSVAQACKINAPAGCLLAGLAGAFILTLYTIPVLRRRLIVAGISGLGGLMVVAAAIIGSAAILELQFDARWYHLETVTQLRDGWNPIYDLCQDRIRDLRYKTFDEQKWWRVQCNSKAPYYFGVGAYVLSGHADALKSPGLLLLASCLLLWLALAFERKGLWDRLNGVLLAFVITLSPMVATQWTTAYVDGQMSALLAIMTGLFIPAIRHRISMLGPTAAITLLIGTKVTAVFILAGTLSVLFLYCLMYRPCQLRELRPVRWTAVLVGLVLLTCINPIITNTFRYSHPLFPYNTPGGQESYNLPAALKLGAFERALLPAMGSFCHSRQVSNTFVSRKEVLKGVHLKNPFSMSLDELQHFSNPDIRIGGMGPLFPAMVIVSLATGVVVLWCSRKAGVFWVVGLGLAYASMVPTGLGSYARYNPQWWMAMFLPILAALPMERRRGIQGFATLLLLLAAANVSLISYSHATRVVGTSNAMKRQLATAERSLTYFVDFVESKDFYPLRTRLEESGISYREIDSRRAVPPQMLGGIGVFGSEPRSLQYCEPFGETERQQAESPRLHLVEDAPGAMRGVHEYEPKLLGRWTRRESRYLLRSQGERRLYIEFWNPPPADYSVRRLAVTVLVNGRECRREELKQDGIKVWEIDLPPSVQGGAIEVVLQFNGTLRKTGGDRRELGAVLRVLELRNSSAVPEPQAP